MNPEDLPSFTRREALAIAATFAVLPTHDGQAQVPAAKLKGLNVGPITWRSIRTDFGAVGNGTSSDFVAFRAFRDWALTQTGWVGLVLPPSSGHYVTAGQYGRGLNTPFLGIKKLVVSGYGASMDGLHSGAMINKAEYRHKIRSVKAGSTTVELIDRASVRFLSVGSMVLRDPTLLPVDMGWRAAFLIGAALADAFASHGDYLAEQQAGFAASFDIQGRSSSLRAAEAIARRVTGP